MWNPAFLISCRQLLGLQQCAFSRPPSSSLSAGLSALRAPAFAAITVLEGHVLNAPQLERTAHKSPTVAHFFVCFADSEQLHHSSSWGVYRIVCDSACYFRQDTMRSRGGAEIARRPLYTSFVAHQLIDPHPKVRCFEHTGVSRAWAYSTKQSAFAPTDARWTPVNAPNVSCNHVCRMLAIAPPTTLLGVFLRLLSTFHRSSHLKHRARCFRAHPLAAVSTR